MKIVELKNCPCCGGGASLVTSIAGWVDGALCAWHAVKCEKCGLRTQESDARYVIETLNGNILCKKDGRKEVIDAWNRRKSKEEGPFR